VDGDVEEVLQRQALRAEVEAVRRLEGRGQALAREREKRPASWDLGAGEQELAEGLARQTAYLLAGKALLLRTHARLEEGLDCAVEAPLLRVWLDDADVYFDGFAGRVQQRLEPVRRYDERPLVEPGAGPPVSSLAGYLAAPASYESGDFLVRPVDLLQPRLMPEVTSEADSAWRAAAGERGRRLLAAVDALRERMGHARTLAGVIRGSGVADKDVPGGMAWRVQRMEEDLFVAEALAFDVVGRSMHPGTQSLRVEWLSARMLVAELRHRVNEAFAEIRGLTEGKEGRGSDWGSGMDLALSVDEPGNARRRFFLLKDLTTAVAPRWARTGGERLKHVSREVLELEALKVQFRERFEAARDLFGQDLWRNPNLQANCLALAEIAGWLQAADSTLGRMVWLYRREGDEGEEPSPCRERSLRALARCHAEVRERLHRFDEDLTQLRRGYYAPHVRAASLLFDRAGQRPGPPLSPFAERTCATLPLSVLVVVEPGPVVRLQPDGDDLREPYWGFGPADQAALETALRWRGAAPEQVRVAVAAVGPRRVGPLLRELLGRGFERAWLVLDEAGDRTVLSRVIRAEGPFDLILGGPRVRPITEALGVPWVEGAVAVAGRGLPAAVAIEAGPALRPFTVVGYLEGLGRQLVVVS
jgi:hypothetical protein